MATPIIFIPGHLCDGRLYDPQRAAFADHPCQIADMVQDDSIIAMAQRVLAAAPPRFVAVGLSMGGMVAMALMGLAPERLAGVALLDTDPTPARDKEIEWRRTQRAAVAERGLAAFVDRFIPAFYGHDASVMARLAAPTRAMMLDMTPAIYDRQSDALDGRPDCLPWLASYAGPVLTLCGAEDKVCPPRLTQMMTAAHGRAQEVLIPNCGHIATLEAPDAVNAALRAWMPA